MAYVQSLFRMESNLDFGSCKPAGKLSNSKGVHLQDSLQAKSQRLWVFYVCVIGGNRTRQYACLDYTK